MHAHTLTTREANRLELLQAARIFLLAIVLVGSALVVADNTRMMRASWLFGHSVVHLYVPLAIAWGSGLICGMLVIWPVGRRTLRRAALEHPSRVVDLSDADRPASTPPPPPPPPPTSGRVPAGSGRTWAASG